MGIPTNALELFNDYKCYYQKMSLVSLGIQDANKVRLVRCVYPALRPKPKGEARQPKKTSKQQMSFQGVSLEEISMPQNL